MAYVLKIYRRHDNPDCVRKGRPADWRRCQCKLYVRGWNGLKRVNRQSLHTSDWVAAERMVNQMIAEGSAAAHQLASAAIHEFRRDIARRGLAPETVRKYGPQLDELEEAFGRRSLTDISAGELRRIVDGWKVATSTQAVRIERLRAFFNFCVENGWIARSPAKAIKMPRVDSAQTLPYTADEMTAILAACTGPYEMLDWRTRKPTGRYREARPGEAAMYRAFVLTMRYSGLRIGDTARLAADRVTGGKVFLYTAKTGAPVYVPLPGMVIEALESFPHVSPRYFFWSGNGSRDGAARSWCHRLGDRVFRTSRVPNAHAHRFRDTFAVEHLKAGTPIKVVSMWLGHATTEMTERNYLPWVDALQKQAEGYAVKSWERDPLVFANKKVEGVQ